MITTNIDTNKNPELDYILKALQLQVLKTKSKYNHYLNYKNGICKLILETIYHSEFEVLKLIDGQTLYFKPDKLVSSEVFTIDLTELRFPLSLPYLAAFNEIQTLRKQNIINRLQCEDKITRDYFYKMIKDQLNKKEGEKIQFLQMSTSYKQWTTDIEIKGRDYWEVFSYINFNVDFPNALMKNNENNS